MNQKAKYYAIKISDSTGVSHSTVDNTGETSDINDSTGITNNINYCTGLSNNINSTCATTTINDSTGITQYQDPRGGTSKWNAAITHVISHPCD